MRFCIPEISRLAFENSAKELKNAVSQNVKDSEKEKLSSLAAKFHENWFITWNTSEHVTFLVEVNI